MIVLIPIGGIGQRFKDSGYELPKALVEVDGKRILSHLLDNLAVDKVEYVMIPYNKEYKQYHFEDTLAQEYPHIRFKFHCLEDNTRGAAETINIALKEANIQQDTPILCLDSDNFYVCDIISKWNGGNGVFTINDTSEKPIFSYVTVNESGVITDIKEKVKISDNACTGAYAFQSAYKLQEYTEKIIEGNITQQSEFYTSGVIKEMIVDGYDFHHIEIENKDLFWLGTPNQVDEYEHPLIFDLDGTLVNTDHIYVSVWHTLMKKFELSIDDHFFNHFVQGKNDMSFLRSIFPDISTEKVAQISQMKDDMFIECLAQDDTDIMIPGSMNFLRRNRNRRMGIVTSCNKKSAEFILKKTGIDKYMNLLIAAEDCKHHKPDKEPYQRAIDILQCDKDKCTIFEDSHSGYKSARALGGTNLCLILSSNSSEYMKQVDEYKIKSYDEFDAKRFNNQIEMDLKQTIKESLHTLPIKDVVIDKQDMKTGYICDIKSFGLHFKNGVEKLILKMENDDNDLSNVAKKIHLYSNEVYFYNTLAQTVGVEVPRFYCSLLIDDKKTILLENLNEYPGQFNVDLNTNIDAMLTVVKHVSEMHNRFQFDTEEEVIPVMKDIYKIQEIDYYQNLVQNRFQRFLDINSILLTTKDRHILTSIRNKYTTLVNKAGSFPLNFCHGDLKSPNIFYKNHTSISTTPVFLDWQYIHLNKGVSDIAFLLTESTDFNETVNDIVLSYYYKKSIMYESVDEFMFDFKTALCIFPFFVMVWFNSENRDNLLDKVFPINYMKNTLKFYNKYLDDAFFDSV